MKVHFRRTLLTGVVPIGIALLLGSSRPAPGPGLFASAGIAAAGLLMVLGLHGLHREESLARPSRWLVKNSDRWYPALLIILQNLFISLTVLLLWFATADLGFPATPLLHAQLMVLLGLSPVRRVLHGTYPPDPSAWRELLVEFLRYVHASLVASFLASLLTRLMIPPGERLEQGLPPGLIFIWVPAVLVIITSIILFIDHVLRKMPAPINPGERDVLD